MTMTGVLSLAIPAGVTGDWLMLLLDASVKGLAILTIAGVMTLLMRKISAAERQLVWVVALAGLLVLPVVSAALPGWQVLPNWRQAVPPPTPEPAPQVTASQQPQSPPLIPAAHEPPAPGHTSAAPVVHNAASPTMPAGPQEISAPPAGTIMTWVMAIWAIGAAACLAPMVLGHLSLWRLRRGARPLTDAPWLALLKQTSEQLGVGRRVTLLRSDRCTMPMVWGIFRVRLLLPGEAADWSAQRRQIVLLHELAHVKRWDCLVKIITQLACGAYWFNPLAWLAAKRIGSEGERACDDLVLAAGNRPSDYAEHLVEISSGLQAGRLAVHSSIAMVRPAKLEGRVRAILNPARIRRAIRRRAILIAAVLAVGIIVPLACIQSEETLEIPPNTPVRYRNRAAETTVTVEGPLADRILHRLNEGPDRAERGVAMSMDTRKYLHIEERTFQVHGSDLILMDDWGVREWVIDDIEATLEALIPQTSARKDSFSAEFRAWSIGRASEIYAMIQRTEGQNQFFQSDCLAMAKLPELLTAKRFLTEEFRDHTIDEVILARLAKVEPIYIKTAVSLGAEAPYLARDRMWVSASGMTGSTNRGLHTEIEEKIVETENVLDPDGRCRQRRVVTEVVFSIEFDPDVWHTPAGTTFEFTVKIDKTIRPSESQPNNSITLPVIGHDPATSDGERQTPAQADWPSPSIRHEGRMAFTMPHDAAYTSSTRVDMAADGRCTISAQEFGPADTVNIVRALQQERDRIGFDARVHIRANRRVTFGNVAAVLNAIDEADITQQISVVVRIFPPEPESSADQPLEGTDVEVFFTYAVEKVLTRYAQGQPIIVAIKPGSSDKATAEYEIDGQATVSSVEDLRDLIATISDERRDGAPTVGLVPMAEVQWQHVMDAYYGSYQAGAETVGIVKPSN